MIFYIRQQLLNVLQKAYPDKFDLLSKFYISYQAKETRSTHMRYSFPTKRIVVNSFSRDPSDIFIDYLHGLTIHIDILFRKETHIDRTFLMIYKKLLDTAIKCDYITIDQLSASSNSKLLSLLQQNFGSFSTWKLKSFGNKNDIYIYVDNAIFIRNVLKSENYYYSPSQQLWCKKISPENYDDEMYFIQPYREQAEFTIIGDGRFWIRPCYKIVLETYDKSSSPLLKALEYEYDKKTNKWFKNIKSKDYAIEFEMIEDIPQQRVSISFIQYKK